MLDNTRRIFIALSLSALMIACSSGKDDNKAKPAAEPKAAEPAPAQGTPPPATADGTGRKTMMTEHPERDKALAEANAAEEEAAAPPSGIIPKVEKLAEKACACKDKKCAGAIQDEVGKLMAEMKDVQANERQTIANAMQKLQKCLAEAQQ